MQVFINYYFKNIFFIENENILEMKRANLKNYRK